MKQNSSHILVAFVSWIIATTLLASSVHASEVDFVSIIEESPDAVKSIGLEKLSASERVALNEFMNLVYKLGQQHAIESSRPPTNPSTGKAAADGDSGTPVYITKIDDDSDNVLKLDNGGIVEITSGFLGYLGYRKDAILFRDGSIWKIWIEGKRTFRCDVLKAPTSGRSRNAELVYIAEVKGDGKILVMLDGSAYKVGYFNVYDTTLWLGHSEALLINGSRLLNLREGKKIINVFKLK